MHLESEERYRKGFWVNKDSHTQAVLFLDCKGLGPHSHAVISCVPHAGPSFTSMEANKCCMHPHAGVSLLTSTAAVSQYDTLMWVAERAPLSHIGTQLCIETHGSWDNGAPAGERMQHLCRKNTALDGITACEWGSCQSFYTFILCYNTTKLHADSP